MTTDDKQILNITRWMIFILEGMEQSNDNGRLLQRAETVQSMDKAITELEQRAKVKGFATLKHLHAAKIKELKQMNLDAQQKEITFNQQISDLTGRLQRAETAHRECSENKDNVITELEQRHAAKTIELVERYATLKHRHAAKSKELEQMKVHAEQKEITFNHQISDLTASLELAESHHSESVDCVICLNEKKTVSVSPCRHMCFCETCASSPGLDYKCPICRAVITGMEKIFW
jgi:hypothetical protein